ncbi:MAG: type II toxin-antitoxin system VapC family toxin [Verrucomicrobiota bacterium]|nr:type II toxin-antitoxin system VapC family toxin [Verrucomicrobiota bacterium]
MSICCDTSFLCSLYRKQVHSPRAIAFMENRSAAVSVTSLLLLEFRQSLRLQVWLHTKDRAKGFSKREAERMATDLASDLKAGVLEIVEVDWAAVHQQAEELSGRHTEKDGHRFADMLHVATALHLEAREFLTFDENQKKLAQAEGMKVPV